jgi:Tol biopolymer transport system component
MKQWEYSEGCYSPSQDKILFARYNEEYSPAKYDFFAGYVSKRTKATFELCIFDIKTNKVKKIAKIAGSTTGIPPDVYISWKGNLIAYSPSIHEATFGHIYIINPDGSNHKLLLDYGKYPEVSPDTTKIAYILNNNEVRIMNIDGSQNQSLYKNNKLAYLKWDNNNTLFLYKSRPFEVYEFNISSGEIKKTTKPYLAFRGMIPHIEIKKIVSKAEEEKD